MGNVFDNPSDGVYDAYGKAVAAGQLYNDTLRRNTAFNALAKVYGPEVGDIKLATDAQALQQAKTMDPLKAQQQTLMNAGLQRDNAFNTANDPATIANNKTVAATNQNTLDQTEQFQKAQRVHAALSGALSTMGTSLNGVTDPNQRLAIFDQQLNQLAPQLGVDPVSLGHELAQQRAAIATQGADALPQIQQQVDALVGANLSSEDRVKLGIAQTNADIAQTKLGIVQTVADTAKANGGLTPAQVLAKQKLDLAQTKQKYTDSTSLKSYLDTVGDIAGQGGQIDQAIAYIKAHPDSTGLVAKGLLGHGAADVAGLPAYQLAQILAPITSTVMLDKLVELKKNSANGASGLGALSDTEGAILRTSQGSIDQGQNGNQLIASLMSLRDKVTRGGTRMGEAYKRAYGSDFEADATKPVPTDTPATDGTDQNVDPTAAPQQAAPTAPPADFEDPDLWQYLTPEQQALWQP